MDVESFLEVALSRLSNEIEVQPLLATFCSETGSSDDEEEPEQLIGQPNIYVRVDIHVGY